ncbi:uncharacterized protein LOC118764681 [Octopus sinensis]|uniref:Uncharacterized protein LOC118764681 n=1 Tax=Octopus sinensis TaxID=2607531 RepID=A0A7E6F169_9MOLL|nr:uncharacterized protein LOC118764681 [Octopus sinensis]
MGLDFYDKLHIQIAWKLRQQNRFFNPRCDEAILAAEKVKRYARLHPGEEIPSYIRRRRRNIYELLPHPPILAHRLYKRPLHKIQPLKQDLKYPHLQRRRRLSIKSEQLKTTLLQNCDIRPYYLNDFEKNEQFYQNVFPLLGEWNKDNECSFVQYTEESIERKTSEDQKIFWKKAKASQQKYSNKLDKMLNQLMDEKLVISKTNLSSDVFYPWKWKTK